MSSFAVCCLVGTVSLGATLRWALAGNPLPVDFVDLRAAHSHLAYYGLLFPLMWAAWARLGEAVPGKRSLVLYGLAVVGSTVGFVREGYGLLAIAGSTWVLGQWLVSAWMMRRGQGWLRPVAPAIVLGAICIPPVAVLTGRDPTLAHQVVQGFLTILLLGAVLPSGLALRTLTAPHAGAWLLGTVMCGAFFGPLHWPMLGLGPVLLAGLLGMAVWRSTLAIVARMGWAAVVVALVALGIGVLPATRPVMVGGFHYVALGPVVFGLMAGLSPRALPPWAEPVWLLGAGTMAATVVVQQWHPGDVSWPLVASRVGMVTAVGATAGGLRWLQKALQAPDGMGAVDERVRPVH